jgi:3-oxoadipate enol-lactonase
MLILTAAGTTRRIERNDQLMPMHRLGPADALYFEHRPPATDDGATFVFFNALTGDAASWEAEVAPALRAEGHGTLLWNFRGQKDSPFGAPEAISAQQIVADAVTLLAAAAPRRPVYVGLSIGGLFAAQAHLGGAPCAGLLLINTLRQAGPRLEWVNAAVHRAALAGGGRLIQDLYLPLLSGPAWQAANRGNFLQDQPYEPLDPTSGTALLLAAGKGADWDLPYERLTMPVTVLSGLQDRVFFDAADVAELYARLPRCGADRPPRHRSSGHDGAAAGDRRRLPRARRPHRLTESRTAGGTAAPTSCAEAMAGDASPARRPASPARSYDGSQPAFC